MTRKRQVAIEMKVREIIACEIYLDERDVTLASYLIDDLGVESIDLVAIVMAVEEEYDITIDDAEVGDIRKVGDLVEIVAEKIS